MFKFIVTYPNGTEQILEFDKDQVKVGRHAKCDIVLDFPDVEGRHAFFLLHDGELVVVDAASETGTFVNGQRISGKRPIQQTDEVRVGNARMHVEYVVKTPQPSTAASVLACPQCKAPIDPGPSSSIVTCSYCGYKSKVSP